ncbi:ATP-binding protein [Bosea sp. TWI1241]|uniref:sensor histidine kinase n=1 Tax=Bosea sp. TWI1241 TaxID=3148904 RepID=UPI00320B4CEE
MSSLRRRLFLLLAAATGAIWLCAVAWTFICSRAELERVLDTRLQEAARMVHSLVAAGNMATAADAPAFEETSYSRQLSCQIWSLGGRLLARSSGAPMQNLARDGEGFVEHMVAGEIWRVYTIVDKAKDVRVSVGDRVGLRNQLVRDLVAGLVAPALLIVPLLGLMIWLSLGRGLKPLNAIAGEIALRRGDDMSAIADGEAPSEVRPLIAALNGLFGKVEAARRHEREITAFAAHELRTPLAGLKTQVQVALAASDPAVRDKALRQTLVSVDRTNRLARQLLALARLEAMPDAAAREPVDLGAALREVDEAAPKRDGVVVAIDPALDGCMLTTEPLSLSLILRNLHENALGHMTGPGRICWRLAPDGAGLLLEDEGPGIPAPELPQVTQRFFRGSTRGTSGTGLGLTIAEMAAGRIGAVLSLENRSDRSGLRCRLGWNAAGESRS